MHILKMHLQNQSPVVPAIIALSGASTSVFNAIVQIMPDFVTVAAGFCGIIVSIYTLLLLRARIKTEREMIETERLKQKRIKAEIERN